ncbi:sugar kinase [Microbacteriaceae bacterium VKM Ac-2854]|nr:sugar kinase [Microbacteriaceae bacterium VKM Ac-2854]
MLISVGNVVIDVVAAVPALPDRGGDVVATSSTITPGGAFNTLVAASRQGLKAAYAGAHGTGPFGELARSALLAEGIDVLLPPRTTADTGWDVALVEADGERTFVTAPGAEGQLFADDLATIEPARADVVHVSGYGLLREPNATTISRWLDALDPAVPVVFDPGPLGRDIAVDVLARVRARAHWWSGNAREALQSTGSADPLQAATTLARSWRGVVVRDGAGGCVLARPDAMRIPGFVVRAVDTNGAGDAHVGAFLAGLAAGLAPTVAARRANAAAALATTRPGPATAPSAAETDALLRRPVGHGA